MRVEEEVRKSVVFICAQRTLLDGSVGVSFIGTAFIVSMPFNTQKKCHMYI